MPLKKLSYVGFMFLICIMAWMYNYAAIFEKRPQATHTWRQTDGTSLARNYYQNGLDFFSPQLQSLEYNEGHTVAELPIVYYLSALSYTFFGFNEGYFRVINFFFFLAGLYGLFYVISEITKSRFLGGIIAAFLFTCPIISYYAFNFLPDTTALGFMLLGFAFLFHWHQKKTIKSLVLFAIFTAIAGAIKITALYFPLSYAGAILLTTNFKKDKNEILKLVFSFASIFAGAIGWLLWSKYYKALYHSEYFLQSPVAFSFSKSVNGYSWQDIGIILSKNIGSIYYNIPLLFLIVLAFVFLIVFIKRITTFDKYFLFLNTIGAISVLLLFYFQYCVHDYYAVIWVVSAIFWVAYFVKYVRLFYSKSTLRIVSVVLILFLGFSVIASKNVLDFRYSHPATDNDLPIELHAIEPFLETLKIPKDALFITPDDFTSNASLYFMNRKGYTGYFLSNSWERYEMAMQKDMRYMACWHEGRETYEYESKLKPVRIGSYGKVRIYKLTY